MATLKESAALVATGAMLGASGSLLAPSTEKIDERSLVNPSREVIASVEVEGTSLKGWVALKPLEEERETVIPCKDIVVRNRSLLACANEDWTAHYDCKPAEEIFDEDEGFLWAARCYQDGLVLQFRKLLL